jgi:EpsI family protein
VASAPGKPALAALVLLLLAAVPAQAVPKRAELRPPRADFAEFPLQMGTWHGQRQSLEPVYLNTLKLDDYVMADYITNAVDGIPGTPAAATHTQPVNLYVAYYASQRTGQSAHSPRSCLPGGGWEILDFSQHVVDGAHTHGAALRVNRVIVEHGTDRQLVYYWFQERGRDITNEYLVKWYLLRDALLRNRTDGALVRLITPLGANELPAAADARLAQFSASMLPTLQSYVPD